MKESEPVNPPEFYTIDAPKFRDPTKSFRFGLLGGGVVDWRFPSNKPHRCRPLLERMGYFIKREEHYDFPLYSADKLEEEGFGHLFGNPYGGGASRAVGGGAFNFEKWSDADPSYCLEWVWIHPYFRRQGILAAAWENWRSKYGEFAIRPPYSRAMLAFLIKVNHPNPSQSWDEVRRLSFPREIIDG